MVVPDFGRERGSKRKYLGNEDRHQLRTTSLFIPHVRGMFTPKMAPRGGMKMCSVN